MAAVAFPYENSALNLNAENILAWANNQFYVTQMMAALQHDITKWEVRYDILEAKTECRKCGTVLTAMREGKLLTNGEMLDHWVIRQGPKQHRVCYLSEDTPEQDIAVIEESDETVEKCLVPIVGANCNQEAFERLHNKLPELASRYFRHCFGHDIQFRHTGDYVITNGRVWKGVKSSTVVGVCNHCKQEFAVQAANDLAIMQIYERISVFIEMHRNVHSIEKFFDRAAERKRNHMSTTMMNPMYGQHGCSRFNVLR